MDLESGATIYVEARTDRKINMEVHIDGGIMGPILTTEEARTVANALLAAVVEAEEYALASSTATREEGSGG